MNKSLEPPKLRNLFHKSNRFLKFSVGMICSKSISVKKNHFLIFNHIQKKQVFFFVFHAFGFDQVIYFFDDFHKNG